MPWCSSRTGALTSVGSRDGSCRGALVTSADWTPKASAYALATPGETVIIAATRGRYAA